MESFENKENFWAFHQKEIDEKMVLDLEYFENLFHIVINHFEGQRPLEGLYYLMLRFL